MLEYFLAHQKWEVDIGMVYWTALINYRNCHYLKHGDIYIKWWITLGKYLSNGNDSFQYRLNHSDL